MSTFLAMFYIVLVNPAIHSEGGTPWAAAFIATAFVAGLATVAMGLWARLPFAVAPGMEINALVVFSAIGTQGFSWQQALGLVFYSGVLMVAVTALGWRTRVVEAIPAAVRTGLVACVGIFIGVVGLTVGGLVGGDWPGVLVSPGAIALGIGFGDGSGDAADLGARPGASRRLAGAAGGLHGRQAQTGRDAAGDHRAAGGECGRAVLDLTATRQELARRVPARPATRRTRTRQPGRTP